jgi:murein DD-endopeptidase MepM/ murein hydrolase activator NlpD
VRERFLLTLTDTRGMRQYSLHRLLKGMAIVLALFVSLAVGGLWWYTDHLRDAYSGACRKERALREEVATLQTEVSRLDAEMARKEEKLASLKRQVEALETILGEPPREHGASSVGRLENIALSAAQIGLLFSLVPNGVPLPMKGVTSAYGWRTHPISKKREFHPGIDLRAKTPKPVWTTADGVVAFAGWHKYGYGKLVIVDHGFGFKTYYGHLSRLLVEKGDMLIKGDLVGMSGNTGRSTAPHLHYEIRFLDKTVNPYWFMQWRKRTYRSIFGKVKQIPWDSLIALVGHMATEAIPPSSQKARGSSVTSPAREGFISVEKWKDGSK